MNAEPTGSGRESTSSSRKGPGVGRRILSSGAELLFLLPILALSFGIVVIPACVAVFRSLYDWDPGYESAFVGLDNFVELFQDETYQQVLKNEAVLLLALPIWTIVPLALALLLYERVRFPGVYRTVFFLPSVMSAAVLGILFRAILAPSGPLNELLSQVGLGALQASWLDNPALVKYVLIFLIVWAGVGMGVIIFSAALSSVQPDLFEAAEIDGASWLAQLWFIAIPSVIRVIYLWFFLGITTILLFSFSWIFVLTRGGPGFASTTLDFDIYQRAFVLGDFGVAAAEATTLLAITLVLIGGALLTRRVRR